MKCKTEMYKRKYLYTPTELEEVPKKLTIDGFKYKLVAKEKHFYRYQFTNHNGDTFYECFDLFDLKLIKRYGTRIKGYGVRVW